MICIKVNFNSVYFLKFLCECMFECVQFWKEGAGMNSARTWKNKCEDNTVVVFLKYIYKFFDNTLSKWWGLILFPLECGLYLGICFQWIEWKWECAETRL